MHDQTVKRIGHFNLAAEPAIRAYAFGKFEHVMLHFALRTGPLAPFGRDIDMAGAAGAIATTIAINPANAVIESALHDRITVRNFYLMFGTTGFNESDARHEVPRIFSDMTDQQSKGGSARNTHHHALITFDKGRLYPNRRLNHLDHRPAL